MLRIISARPCQNGHNLPLSHNCFLEAPKVVCTICEIVVKDREGPAGVYALKYVCVKEGVTPIPSDILADVLRGHSEHLLFQWFCPSLTKQEAKCIGEEAKKRSLKISIDPMKNIIEEMIPQLRSVKTEVGADAIDRIRQAVFNIEKELGVNMGAKKLTVGLMDIPKNPTIQIPIDLHAHEIPISAVCGRRIPITPTITRNDNLTIIKERTGRSCKKCNEFNQYAESNQADGTFECYSCRKGR